ncbi:MAG TPA: hypothetical protein VF125_03170 [Solirubrobacterales bacterium]
MALRVLLLCSVLLACAGAMSPAAEAACANEEVRIELSADLPDCRAYELVTPPDSNGRRVGAVRTFGTPPTYEFPVEHASPFRDSIVFGVYSSPLLSPGGATGVIDIYQAERGAGGWETTRRISPPGSEAQQSPPGGVSPDHQYALATVEGSSPLALGGPTEYLVNPDGTYELVGLGGLGSEPFARGRWISNGGEHVIFATGGVGSHEQSPWCKSAGPNCKVLKLEDDAPPTGTGAIYDRAADGPTHVVSLLPGDITPEGGEEAFFKGASKDGTTVAFEIEGTLYVRVPDELDGETIKVAEGTPTFAGLSANGRYAFYVSDGNIHRFDTKTEEDDQVNFTGDARVSNVSADGSHVYFISELEIDGGGSAGLPNIYVWSGGPTDFVATVAPSDLIRTSGDPTYAQSALGNWTSRVVNAAFPEPGPGAEASRTTPDGSVYVFESRAQVIGYDNKGHVEVYRYDDTAGSLDCVSCNSLASPTTDARLQEPVLTGLPTIIHNLTDSGDRVFFETEESLVGRDEDGVNDIYQWAQGEGGGATVDLLSSGQSTEYPLPPEAEGQAPSTPFPNVLLSVTPDGKDVVFLAQEALVPGAGEGGTAAIYDARVNGGFPAPRVPSNCREEACRSETQPPPQLQSPSSEALNGSGNVKPRTQRRHRRCHEKAKSHKRKRCGKRKGSRQQARSSVVTSPYEAVEAAQPPTGAEAQHAPASSASSAASVAAVGPYDEFGIESVGAFASTTSAATHPDFTTNITLNHRINEKTGRPESNARTEEVSISLPPGLTGNPNLVTQCKTGELVAFGNCPADSQVGVTTILTTLLKEKMTMPVYSLEPPHPNSEVARFGFFVFGGYAVFIDVAVRTAGDYGVTATVHSSPGLTELLGADTTIWGNPADPSHDEHRMTTIEAIECGNGTACKEPGGRPSGLDPNTTVFLTNSSACQKQSVGFAVKSYQLPGQVFSATAPMSPTNSCTGLPFDPTFVAQPTNTTAGAPTGLKTTLHLPQVEDFDTKGTATMREARVTLPEGMTIAAGAANGLASCSDDQVGFHKEVDAACPDASKLGTATITSPALPEPLEAALYQRTPTPGHLFGLWLVTDELGLHVKLPGEIEPDPDTGQLTAVFSGLPQVPVEEISFDVWGGPRAPLKNPDSCGTYATSYTFTPHSNDPAVSGRSQMTIDQGCGGGGFAPKLHAGVTRPVAGAFSPFALDVVREDGEQNLGALEVTLPKGELAKLAGVPLCPDAGAAVGDCPAASKIGSITAAVGPGPQPLWLPQPDKAPTAVYLGGPYQGAPFSVVTVVPAQAGPFDLGLVTVQSALDLDPETAQAIVKTDPLPQFIEGVAAIYRRLHVVIDRPGFSLNPTNCSELQTTSNIASTKGAVAHPASRFQVDGCRALEFKPRLALELKGGTKRGEYPALSATVRARKRDANIGRVSVALPHSEFLAQEHIVTICTRKRFAAGTCPKGSIYGQAKAWTPLLEEPLEGPVYLRSSDHELPDLVMALRGQIEVDLVGRIDSVNGGIRTNFDAVPDAPVTKFVLKMKGGQKSLLVNSTGICRGKHRALVRMRAQNGRALGSRPLLESSGCQKKLSKNK